MAIFMGSLVFNYTTVSATTVSEETNQAIEQRQKNVKKELSTYLDGITKDGTTSVSFYNLGATSGSSAGNPVDEKLYKAGSMEGESNAHAVQTSASTYKLYIAAYLMHQKLMGNFSWTAANTDGFTRMIVNSENDFAESQILQSGASTISSYLESQGWYNPFFQTNQVAQTTSYSLQLLLTDLAKGKGSFQNKDDRNKILNLMGKQIYRSGIPAGADAANSGTTVEDKVGFLDDANNDAGIVTLPNGQKYILVILTNGHGQTGFSGFPRITTITEKIQSIVYDSDEHTQLVNYSKTGVNLKSNTGMRV